MHHAASCSLWRALGKNRIEMDVYNGGIDEFREQVHTVNVKWDVVDFEYSDLIQACETGLLEKVDQSSLPPGADGTPATDDFIDGALTECGVGTYIWVTVCTYEKSVFPGDKPTTIAGFFDVKKFPGKRGLRKDPRGAFEPTRTRDGVVGTRYFGSA